MFKPAHKVLGIEMTPNKIIMVADTVGRVTRQTLDYSALTAGQQAKLDTGTAKRRLGQ